MNLFCKHEWKLLSDKITESIGEKHKRITGQYLEPSNEYQAKATYKNILIQILTCTKCGKIKRYETEV